MSNFPISESKLTQIATDACSQVFGDSTEYTHSKTHNWNQDIINKILRDLITNTTVDEHPPQFKFAINSTIIQHRFGPGVDAAPSKTGMNSSMGAYWNNARDGMWSFKWDGEERGLDVVISIIWIAVDDSKALVSKVE